MYLLPEEVVTTSPALAPFFTGDVEILVPERKFLELLIIPLIDPSAFCLKLLRTGTSLATAAGFLAPPKEKPGALAAGLGLTTALVDVAAGAAGLGLDPNREKVGLFCAGLAGGAAAAFGATFLGAPPKENPPDFFTGVGAAGAAGSSFLAGCDPNKLNVGDFVAAFLGGGVVLAIEIVPGPDLPID